ncbi:MAG TPA: hypothetical protein VGD01_04955 [Candidatus Elarobacter sp.]|jgi:hypothetical protein
MRTFKVLAAAALAALAAGPALAQQIPSDTGTSAGGPITILKNMQAEPDGVVVRVDGAEVDHLQVATYDDITGVVHPGQNTLTVTWSGPIQSLNFKIAYAPTRNNFKDVVVVKADAAHDASLRKAGARALTFTIPGSPAQHG